MSWSRRPTLAAAIAACAFGVLVVSSSWGGSGGPTNAGIVWGARVARDGEAVIRGASVDGSGAHTVAAAFGDDEGDPAWSLDGQALAFYARNSDSFDLHIMRPGTKSHRVLRSDWKSPVYPRRQFAFILEPSWAPDGDHIAVSDSWSFVNATIRIVSVSTKRWTSLTKPSSHRTDVEPAWSPDGQTVAFVRGATTYGEIAKPVIYLKGSDGRGLRRLTAGRSPSWSPASQALVFAFKGGIYRIDADGQGRTRIAGSLKTPDVRWSPDGMKILFTTTLRRGVDLWVANPDGTGRARLKHLPNVNGIAWQPG